MSSPTTTLTPRQVQASEGHQSNTPQQDTIRPGTQPQIKAGKSNPIETKGSQEQKDRDIPTPTVRSQPKTRSQQP